MPMKCDEKKTKRLLIVALDDLFVIKKHSEMRFVLSVINKTYCIFCRISLVNGFICTSMNIYRIEQKKEHNAQTVHHNNR